MSKIFVSLVKDIVMKVIFSENGLSLIETDVHKDGRGYFYESFNEKEFKEKVADVNFVQDNESCSSYGVIRGMHFQKPPYAQAKLVRVVKGAVVDFVVDIRKGSPNYGKVYYAYLSEENHRQFFVPRGFAHGFVALKDNTVFQYKCDNFYNKESEGAIFWMDPDIKIPWVDFINFPDAIVSEKDKMNRLLEEIDNPFVYGENC